jgi:hypothetical protein
MIQYFLEGVGHITDFGGYDHMLYLAALCAPFTLRNWKKVVLLATAFTAGHSVALFLAATDYIRFSSDLIETLIPLTIMLTCLLSFAHDSLGARTGTIQYAVTAGFGLIHGMGFSSYFRMIANESGEFIQSLLLFNLGVEVGQLLIVAILLCFASLVTGVVLPGSEKKYAIFLSIGVLIVSSYLFIIKIIGE